MPLDRYYHRGHTWVQPADDGCFTVGLDDLALRMIGKPEQIELPAVGTEISAQGTGWVMKKGKASLRVLAPMDGVVVEQGTEEAGWYLKIRPKDEQGRISRICCAGRKCGPGSCGRSNGWNLRSHRPDSDSVLPTAVNLWTRCRSKPPRLIGMVCGERSCCRRDSGASALP